MTRLNTNAIITIILTLLCPPLGLIVSIIALYKDFGNWKTYILCIAWGMAVLAYCYEPTTASDLVRYYDYARRLRGLSFKEALNIGQYGNDNLYVFAWVCWFVSSILQDIHLLPAISVFSVYCIALYVSCDFGNSITGDKKRISSYIILLLMMVSFYSVVNNVRNIWAFSMVGLAFYRECYQKKRNLFTIFLYIAPVFIHSSAVIFIILRLALFVSGKLRWIITGLVFVVPLGLNFFSSRLANITSSNFVLRLLIGTINTGNDYFEHSTSAWALVVANSGSEKLNKALAMTLAVVIVASYFLTYKKRNSLPIFSDSGKNNLKVFDFAFMCALMALSCIPMVMPEYWRFICIAILFGAGFYILVNDLWGRFSFAVNILIKAIAIIMMGIWIRNLFLYSDVPVMIWRAFCANPVTLFVLKMMGLSIESIK